MDTHEDIVTSMTDLPDDCLLMIFLRLESCGDCDAFGLTCRRWLQIQCLGRGSLQLRSSYRSDISQDYVRCLSRLLMRFQRLDSINLTGCTGLPDLALTQLQFYGSKLQTLYLDCCIHITDDGLATVSKGCPSLVSISLYRCIITDVGLEVLARSCSNLEKVNLSYCFLISDRGIRALSRSCDRLRAVTISYCRDIRGFGFQGCSPTLSYLEADSCMLTPEGLLGAVSGGGLQYLNVSCLRGWVNGDGLAGIGAGYAVRLQYLNLRLCRFVGDESVEAIAKGCPALKEWNLAVCHGIRVRGWDGIGLYCHKLEILHVNRCQNLCNRGLLAIQDGCERLAVLYMHGCRQVNCVGLESFKRVRWNVRIRREECMCVGPSLDKFFC